MNYSHFFWGDYLRDTGHLTLAEHGAYVMLLAHYYSTERPLPAPVEPVLNPGFATVEQVYRLGRAVTQEERSAIDSVLHQFFVLKEDGWHNKRADQLLEESITYRQSQAEKGRKSGQARKNHGLTTVEPQLNRGLTGVEPSTTTTTTTKVHTQEIEPSNTDSKKEKKASRKSRLTTLPANFSLSDRVRKWAAERGYARLDEHLEYFVMRCKARNLAYADWDEGFMTAVRDNWAKLPGYGPTPGVLLEGGSNGRPSASVESTSLD